MLILLLVGGCAERAEPVEPAASFPPLSYDYLTPLRLNVASVSVEQRFVPEPSGADMTPFDPVSLTDTIRRMAADRLQPLGTSGRAVLAINDASILRRDDAYEGSAAVELDIYTSADTRAAFAEARVTARRDASGRESRGRALYALTKQLMDALNVELEYQVHRSLTDWLVATPVSTTAPVEQQALPPPPGAPAPAPVTGGPALR